MHLEAAPWQPFPPAPYVLFRTLPGPVADTIATIPVSDLSARAVGDELAPGRQEASLALLVEGHQQGRAERNRLQHAA